MLHGIIFYVCFSILLFSKEVRVKEIPLQGLITNPKQEISGMDWYEDNLFLLPENLEGFLFMIPESKIHYSIKSLQPEPIEPKKIAFITPNYSKTIPAIGKFIVGSSKPYEYLINSIDAFYNQEQLLELITKNGFTKVEYRNLSNGISAIHSGWKI